MVDTLSFDGRVAIVTGAGGGLGRAHALELARRGARVVVNDRGTSISGAGTEPGAAERTVAEIAAAGGEAASNTDSVEDGERIVECAIRAFGRIDIVVNNAGILRDRAFHNMTPEEWDQVYRVHLLGAFKTTRAAWPYLREQGYGRLVFTSSAAGLFGNFGQANYAAMKLGLIGLCRTLAIEGSGKGIKANTISPSASSRMSATMGDHAGMADLKADHVSALAALLCHESCPVSGRVFAAGGGWFGEIREQQSRGVRLNDDASPERILANWSEITDFSRASAPANIQDALEPILESVPGLRDAVFGTKP